MTPVNNDSPVYTIGTAAKMLSVSVQTLRLYEHEGLILPFKTPGNQRMYSPEDIERLRCIRKMINEEKISIDGRGHLIINAFGLPYGLFLKARFQLLVF